MLYRHLRQMAVALQKKRGERYDPIRDQNSGPDRVSGKGNRFLPLEVPSWGCGQVNFDHGSRYLLGPAIQAACDAGCRSGRNQLASVCCHTSAGCSSSPEHGNCVCRSDLSCRIPMAWSLECSARPTKSCQLRPAPGHWHLGGDSRHRSYGGRFDRSSSRTDVDVLL